MIGLLTNLGYGTKKLATESAGYFTEYHSNGDAHASTADAWHPQHFSKWPETLAPGETDGGTSAYASLRRLEGRSAGVASIRIPMDRYA